MDQFSYLKTLIKFHIYKFLVQRFKSFYYLVGKLGKLIKLEVR